MECCSSPEVNYGNTTSRGNREKNIENNRSFSGEDKEFDQQNMHCCCFQADQKKLTLSVRFQIEIAKQVFVKITFKTKKNLQSKIMPGNTIPMFNYQDGTSEYTDNFLN